MNGAELDVGTFLLLSVCRAHAMEGMKRGKLKHEEGMKAGSELTLSLFSMDAVCCAAQEREICENVNDPKDQFTRNRSENFRAIHKICLCESCSMKFHELLSDLFRSVH